MPDVTVPKVRLYADRAADNDDWSVNVGHVSERGRWQTEPHAHPAYAQINFVRQGRGVLNVEGTTVPFEGPCALILPPSCIHGLDYEADVDRWVVTIEAKYLSKVSAKLPEFHQVWATPALLQFSDESEVAGDFYKTIRSLEAEVGLKHVGGAVATESLLVRLMLQMVRATRTLSATNDTVSYHDARVAERFRQLVDLHYRENLRTQQYAAMMATTVSKLRAACMAATAQTPTKIIHARLIAEAKRSLIFGSTSVEQIAVSLGFTDSAYLTYFFRREVGQTPAKFREAARERLQSDGVTHSLRTS